MSPPIHPTPKPPSQVFNPSFHTGKKTSPGVVKQAVILLNPTILPQLTKRASIKIIREIDFVFGNRSVLQEVGRPDT